MKKLINKILVFFGLKKKIIKLSDIPLYNDLKWFKGDLTLFEQDLLYYIQYYRDIRNMPLLHYDVVCQTLAMQHSRDMYNKRVLSHNEVSKRMVFLFEQWKAKSYSEIVAYEMTPNKTLKAWLNSKHHKKLLNDKHLTNFGLSSKKAKNGAYYTTLITIRK